MSQTNRRLTSLDDLFGEVKTEDASDNGWKEVDIDQLVPFSKHPFKLYEGERFDDMVQSIKEYGILAPLIVRPLGLQFEILAGHNRWNAAKEVGLKKIPVIIKDDLTDDEAMIIVIETNLIQRSFTDLPHSERAFVIAQEHTALKNQGRRTDIMNEIKTLLNADEIKDESTSSPLGKKLTSMDISGKEYGLSKNSVARYLRINKLNEGLKAWIDSEEISIRAGVELSYITNDNQMYLIDILKNNKCKIDIKLATELRNLEKRGSLDEKAMTELIFGEKKKLKKAIPVASGIKVKPKILKKYFNESQGVKEVEDIIDKALQLYYQNENKKY